MTITKSDELEELRAWKAAVVPLLIRYDDIAESIGGNLGESKVANLERYMQSGLGKLTAADHAALREILLETVDDGCTCAGPHPQDKHPWELVEGHTNGDGDVVTEAIANEQRLKLADELLRKVKEATI